MTGLLPIFSPDPACLGSPNNDHLAGAAFDRHEEGVKTNGTGALDHDILLEADTAQSFVACHNTSEGTTDTDCLFLGEFIGNFDDFGAGVTYSYSAKPPLRTSGGRTRSPTSSRNGPAHGLFHTSSIRRSRRGPT